MNDRLKLYLTVFSVVLLFWMYLFGFSGTFQPSQVTDPDPNGTQVLRNAGFWWGLDYWDKSSWRSAGGTATSAVHTYHDGKVTMAVGGYDASFYAVAVKQGAGSSPFGWEPQNWVHVSINESCNNVVSWRGIMDMADLTLTGNLGMGIDFWFDAVFPSGEVKAVEMYVFFYMQGAYALPVGSYKLVVRQDYNSSSQAMGMEWDYVYFHAWQADQGVDYSHSFELYDYVAQFKQAKPNYSDAEFVLTKVDACMELFMGQGMFTVDYLGLSQYR